MPKVKSNAFIKTVTGRYRQSVLDERTAIEALSSAQRVYREARDAKRLYEALLRKEGVDPETIEIGIDPTVVRAATEARNTDTPLLAPSNGNQPQPMSATHTVYLVMRKRDNVGLRPNEILRFCAEDGMPIRTKDLHKVIWTQINKGRMARDDDGKIRLTAEGDAFNSFRSKGEEALSV